MTMAGVARQAAFKHIRRQSFGPFMTHTASPPPLSDLLAGMLMLIADVVVVGAY